MKNDIYLDLKSQLQEVAKLANKYFKNDKPAIRETINNNLDTLIRYQLNHTTISQQRFNLYCKWLESLACKLHPKN